MTTTQTDPAIRIARALEQSEADRNQSGEFPELTPNAKQVLARRYLAKNHAGEVVEDPEGMFRRVARNLSQADLLYGAGEEQRQETENRFHRLMRSLKFLPNSPTLMNAGRELQQLSACFVLPVPDSLDGIFGSVLDTAMIHKSGGGTGFSFSRLRPEGDIVGSTGGIASGPVSFIRAFDTATDVVKQGSARRGANMGILDVSHPDILAFIRAKSDGVSLQNFNISVAVSDDFMQKVQSGEDYELVNPRDGSAAGTLNAAGTFDLIAKSAWATGDPGLVFLDRVNRDNPNPQLGRIESSNPCGEQFLLPHESCNLGSINLARMTRTGEDGRAEIDWSALDEAVETAVHLLDNVIDMNRYPIPEIEEMTRKTRRIGLGVMGFADMLVRMGIPYDSDEALDTAAAVLGHIRRRTKEASRALAADRGPFPEWPASAYNNDAPDAAPMRNTAPTTIAPTGTISIIAGASSGIEPLFALAYERNVMDNTRLTEVNPALEAVAKAEGFHSGEFARQVAAAGSLQHTDAPQWAKDIFRVSHDISPQWHVKMQARAQAYIDNAVSKTINMPAEATPEDVAAAYIGAWQGGCKGITIYRDGSKEGQVLSVPGHQAQNGAKPAEPAPDGAGRPEPRSRPQSVRGVTDRVRTGHGNMYVTVNFDEEGKPFEVFANQGKAGGCDSAQIEAVSRLISLALRSGIPAEPIIEQMQGITCCTAWDEGVQVKSGPDAIAVTLRRIAGGERAAEAAQPRLMRPDPERSAPAADGPRCPDCNSRTYFQEGCVKCPGCGWNRCE